MKGFELDEALLRQLADVMAETGLTEIEMADGERSLRVAKQAAAAAMVPAAMPAAVAPAPAATADSATASSSGSGYADADLLNSPMVGTGYLSPEPGAAPFIKVGDQVTPDKTVMIIEAMKVMNPITAPRAGKITQIIVQNEQPVEFDQPLVIIE